MKRLMTLMAAVATLTVAGCGSCNSCGGSESHGLLHCERPCYGKNLQREGRQMMDFVDVYFFNYDKHDPFRCSPCLGD